VRQEVLERHPDALGRRRGHVGLDEPRRHRVRGHPEPTELDGEGLGEALEPRLGRGVVGLPAVALRRRRRQVDDPAVLLGRHVGLARAGHEEGALEVHRHHGVPVALGHLEDEVVADDAGVVDEHHRRA
jgi:hypothetical protein